MKILKIMNTIAILLPIIIFGTYPILKDDALFWSIYSTMLTGFLQVIIGLVIWIKDLKNTFIQLYLLGVILFFIGVSTTNSGIFWLMPPILCIYLSNIIYKRKKL